MVELVFALPPPLIFLRLPLGLLDWPFLLIIFLAQPSRVAYFSQHSYFLVLHHGWRGNRLDEARCDGRFLSFILPPFSSPSFVFFWKRYTRIKMRVNVDVSFIDLLLIPLCLKVR